MKTVCGVIFAGSIVWVFVYLYYLKFTVSCPECQMRLEIINQGFDSEGASARCNSCGQTFNLGISFQGGG